MDSAYLKTCPNINLSGSLSYSFLAADNNAAAVIAALARAMRLEEGPCQGRKVFVYTGEQDISKPKIHIPADEHEPILCTINPYDTEDLLYIQVEQVAQAVAADVICRGGALIHGGLCSLNGHGAIMAGRGGIGKTTASGRLPAPWISYCDDSSLIIPNRCGTTSNTYIAHPWPTWSRFYWGGAGGNWSVEEKIPLAILFFLSQTESDHLEPLDKYQAKSMLIDTIEHVTRSSRKKDKDKEDFVLQCIKSAGNIATAVPAYRLGVSLTGKFWREMEGVMPKTELPELIKHTAKQLPAKYDQEKLHVIYRGSSMNPTFFEPEMLTVVPYREKEPKKGDIICYRVDQKDENIVHRIIAIGNSGIKTRGDNSTCADDYIVDKEAVIGMVVSSRKYDEIRPVYGGRAGVLAMYLRRGYRTTDRFLTKILQKSYFYLAASGIFRKLKPNNMVFKVAVFERYRTKYPKLILNGRTVGTYDFRKMAWKVKRPYRLFVDEQNLPAFEKPELYRPVK